MPIDASIALGVRPPQFESPVNAMAKIMQLKGLQQDQEMNTMRADEYRRGVDRQNRLMGLMQGGSDPEALRRGGFLKEAADWEKNSADTGKTKAETDKTAFNMNKERFGVVRKTAASFANDPQITKDRVVSALQLYAVGGVIPETLATQFSQGLPDDPAQLRAALQNFAKQDLTSEQLFTLFAAKPEKVDNGQQIGFRDTNPNSPTYGQNTAGAPVQKMQDPNSVASVGASYANASATREIAKATRDAAGMQRDQATEMKLADDYRAQSKDFKAVGDAYKQISATLDKATTSPAATLAAATKFMKLLDPGSVVRESELGMALAATGVFDRATNYVNTLRYGKVLTPAQAKDFKNITAQIYGAAQAGQKQVDAAFTRQAETYKLRPEMVLQDLGQNTPAGQPKSTQGGDSDPLGIRSK